MNGRRIILYSVPNCPYCEKARQYLREKGLEFEDIDVLAENKRFAKEMILKSGQKTVPVLDIDGRIMVGFEPKQFENIINYQ